MTLFRQPVDTRHAEVPNAEEGEELQEQGEESADEHDPIVEYLLVVIGLFAGEV